MWPTQFVFQLFCSKASDDVLFSYIGQISMNYKEFQNWCRYSTRNMLNNKWNYRLTWFQGNQVSKQFPGPLDLLFLTYSHFSPTAKEAGTYHRQISSVLIQMKMLPKHLWDKPILGLTFWSLYLQCTERSRIYITRKWAAFL